LTGKEFCKVSLTGKAILRMEADPAKIFDHKTPGKECELVVKLIDMRDPSRREPFIAKTNNPDLRVISILPVNSSLGTTIPEGCQLYQMKVLITVPKLDPINGNIFVRTESGERLCSIPIQITPENRIRTIPSRVVFSPGQYLRPNLVSFDSDEVESVKIVEQPPWIDTTINRTELSVKIKPESLPSSEIVRGEIILTVTLTNGSSLPIHLPVIVFAKGT
jgi:hypothetical protein